MRSVWQAGYVLFRTVGNAAKTVTTNIMEDHVSPLPPPYPPMKAREEGCEVCLQKGCQKYSPQCLSTYDCHALSYSSLQY